MAAPKKKSETDGSFEIAKFKVIDCKIFLIGDAPMMVHAFPEKARKEMIDKQRMVAKPPRGPRDPWAEFEASRYLFNDEYDGFPAIAFKASAVTAVTSLSDVTKVAARQAFTIYGEQRERPGVLDGSIQRTALVPIIAPPPFMREDVVRLAGPSRTAEVRYRPEYSPWGVALHIRLNPGVISFGQLGTMFELAGAGVGVGEYRAERDGDLGTFRVVTEAEFEEHVMEVAKLRAEREAQAEKKAA